jgi:rare lipoprotein A
MKTSSFYFIIITLILSSCSSYNSNTFSSKNPFSGGVYKIGEPYTIQDKIFFPEEDFFYKERGIASWYGEKFHGKKTANGEIFNMNLLTAAHRTLQLPSLVKVTNINNKKSIILRVNDRGPFAKDRIIDLSKKSAALLGFQKAGTTEVIVEYYGRANVYDLNGRLNNKRPFTQSKKNIKKFILSVGVFSNKSNIEKIKTKLKGLGKINIQRLKKDESLYKVFLGPFRNKDFVYRVKKAVSQRGLENSIVEKLD